MDDLTEVSLEILGSQTFKVCKSSSRNVSLPLKFTFTLINHSSEFGVLLHVLDKGLGKLQLTCRCGDLSSGQTILLLLIIRSSILGQFSHLAHEGCEDNQIEIFVNVVHDLGLEEDLCGI